MAEHTAQQCENLNFSLAEFTKEARNGFLTLGCPVSGHRGCHVGAIFLSFAYRWQFPPTLPIGNSCYLMLLCCNCEVFNKGTALLATAEHTAQQCENLTYSISIVNLFGILHLWWVYFNGPS